MYVIKKLKAEVARLSNRNIDELAILTTATDIIANAGIDSLTNNEGTRPNNEDTELIDEAEES